MRQLWVGGGLTALVLILSCASAWAQNNGAAVAEQTQNRLQQLQQFEEQTRLLANPEIPAGQRALIDWGGYFSPQYYSIDDSNHDNHSFWEYDLVGYLRMDFDGANQFFFRGELQYNDYISGGSFDGFPSRLLDPYTPNDRAFYKFDLANYEAANYGKTINGDLTFEGGQDLVYWGNGLVLGQVVDGVMPGFRLGDLSVATVAGVTPLRTIDDVNPDRPAFDYNTQRGFYGVMATVNVAGQHPYVYGLLQQDYNKDNVSVAGPIYTRYSYNSGYIGAGSSGPISDHLRYGIEAAWEGGDDLSTSSQVSGFQLIPITQTRDSIVAWAGDVKLDYVPQDAGNSRITLEGIMASGDTDRGLTNTTFNGNAPNTLDRAFSGFGLLSTGLAFGSAVSNLMVLRVGPSTFPFTQCETLRRLQVGSDLYIFGKTNNNAPIDVPTNSGVRYLGWEPDLYLNWAITSDVTFTARYGVFFENPTAFVDPGARQFVYTGVTFAF
jgi:hypothetical protein